MFGLSNIQGLCSAMTASVKAWMSTVLLHAHASSCLTTRIFLIWNVFVYTKKAEGKETVGEPFVLFGAIRSLGRGEV